MALFRRKEVTEEVPELEKYYAQKRTSSAMSWLFAVATMFLTILIVLGLFFGGRWAYRQIVDNDKKDTPTVQTPSQAGQNPQQVTTLPGDGSEGSTSGSAQTNPTNTSGGVVSESTASATASLPNSGPGEVISIALIAGLGAYVARLYFVSRQNS